MAIDTDKLEAVAWMYRTEDEIWVALDHEDPDAISVYADETPLTDLNRANEIIAEKEAEIARLAARCERLEGVLPTAAEELEYFVEFARRQFEFEGDADAGFAVVRAIRDALEEPSQ